MRLTVSRQIATNHFIHFLALDRSDPKKFQVLQLIAALLAWTEEEREKAGLARPGSIASSSAGTGSLRLPQSPASRLIVRRQAGPGAVGGSCGEGA